MGNQTVHINSKFKVEIEKMMGVPLPADEEKISEDVEVQLSKIIALASDKLLQKDEAEAQQQKAQQQSQDPIIQMQKAELELKQAKFQHDKAMDEAELNLKSQDMASKDERENKRIDSQAEIAGAKIALSSVEIQQQVEEKKEERQEQNFKEGVKIGFERATTQTD